MLRVMYAVVIGATAVLLCQAASKKFPVSCDSARKTIVPWLETRGFSVVDDDLPKPNGHVLLKGKRPKSADGKRIWNLQHYARNPEGLTVGRARCFEYFDIVGVSAKLRFRPAAEGCAVLLQHQSFRRGAARSRLRGLRVRRIA